METKDEALAEHIRRMNLLQYAAKLEDLSVGMWVFGNAEGWRQVASVSDRNYMVKQDDSCSTLVNADAKRCRADQFPGWFTVDIFEGTSPPAPEPDWLKVALDRNAIACRFWEGDGAEEDDSVEGVLHAYLTDKQDQEFPFVAFIDEVGFRRFKHCRLVDPKPEWLEVKE